MAKTEEDTARGLHCKFYFVLCSYFKCNARISDHAHTHTHTTRASPQRPESCTQTQCFVTDPAGLVWCPSFGMHKTKTDIETIYNMKYNNTKKYRQKNENVCVWVWQGTFRQQHRPNPAHPSPPRTLLSTKELSLLDHHLPISPHVWTPTGHDTGVTRVIVAHVVCVCRGTLWTATLPEPCNRHPLARFYPQNCCHSVTIF